MPEPIQPSYEGDFIFAEDERRHPAQVGCWKSPDRGIPRPGAYAADHRPLRAQTR